MEHTSASTPDQAKAAGLLFTAAEFGAHRQELERLLEIRDRDLPQLFRDARTFVASDTAEEMVQIREDLVVVEARIGWLDAVLREARLIDDNVAPGLVGIGRETDVEYVGSGRVVTYRITGGALSAGPGTISAGSPAGRALIGRTAGDVVEVNLPGGRSEHLRVLAVRPGATPDDSLTADGQALAVGAVHNVEAEERSPNQGAQ